MFNKKSFFISMLLLIFLTIGMVSASDNLTDEVSLDDASAQSIETPISSEIESNANESSQISEDAPSQVNTKMEAKDVTTYYKEKSELVGYLKDTNNQPISGKKVSISINNKVYDKITDNSGKVVLKLNLKPGTYTASVKFAGPAADLDSAVKVTIEP